MRHALPQLLHDLLDLTGLRGQVKGTRSSLTMHQINANLETFLCAVHLIVDTDKGKEKAITAKTGEHKQCS